MTEMYRPTLTLKAPLSPKARSESAYLQRGSHSMVYKGAWVMNTLWTMFGGGILDLTTMSCSLWVTGIICRLSSSDSWSSGSGISFLPAINHHGYWSQVDSSSIRYHAMTAFWFIKWALEIKKRNKYLSCSSGHICILHIQWDIWGEIWWKWCWHELSALA